MVALLVGREDRWWVSETPENIALAELLGSISDRRIRRKVHKLLQLGEEAVRSLGELDAALYLREGGEEQLQIVSDAVLSHVRRLLEYLGMVASTEEARPAPAPEVGDFELPTGDSQEPHRSARAGSTPGIIAQREKTDEGKWSALAREMDSLHYGLGSELKEYDRRFAEALKRDHKEQAVRDLNDATTSLMDGVFAVMTTVYECFLGYAEPERMIPGHRDTLGKSLAVRRALALLRREVRELNRSIQNRESDPLVVETSYRLIVASLDEFVGADVFYYLRSDSRKEFEKFREVLAHGDATRNRQDCEGFDKYLDSLAFVSQRGVLIKHDTDLRAKIADELDRALKYAELLPEVVCEAVHEAFVKGDRLFGLNDQIDALVYRWTTLSEEQRSDLDLAVDMARTLHDLVAPPPAPPPPGEGDFF
jgi:hypothetical protein